MKVGDRADLLDRRESEDGMSVKLTGLNLKNRNFMRYYATRVKMTPAGVYYGPIYLAGAFNAPGKKQSDLNSESVKRWASVGTTSVINNWWSVRASRFPHSSDETTTAESALKNQLNIITEINEEEGNYDIRR